MSTFVLGGHREARDRALQAVREAPDGMVVQIKKKTRNLEQNARFHAICQELALQRAIWAGEPRSATEWKVLLISGHAVETLGEAPDIVRGIGDEVVSLREKTSRMTVSRMSSLISYSEAFLASLE